MDILRRSRRSLLTLCLSMIGAGVFAQVQVAQEQIQPQVGQDGKDVIWIPTPAAVVDKMLDMARLTPQDYLIDLGSGDGRTVIAAAKRGARALGIEYNGEMVALSERNAAREDVGARAVFSQADLFESDFSQATVITMFLLPDLNLMLRPRILALKPGTRVVSNTFTMGDWLADETVDRERQLHSMVHRSPVDRARKGGRHVAVDSGRARAQASVSTDFGNARTSGGSTAVITNGILRGDRLSFSAAGSRYTGYVTTTVIEGSVSSGETARPVEC